MVQPTGGLSNDFGSFRGVEHCNLPIPATLRNDSLHEPEVSAPLLLADLHKKKITPAESMRFMQLLH
jgi:hypothetical protein